jgi:hypothetical protein
VQEAVRLRLGVAGVLGATVGAADQVDKESLGSPMRRSQELRRLCLAWSIGLRMLGTESVHVGAQRRLAILWRCDSCSLPNPQPLAIEIDQQHPVTCGSGMH